MSRYYDLNAMSSPEALDLDARTLRNDILLLLCTKGRGLVFAGLASQFHHASIDRQSQVCMDP